MVFDPWIIWSAVTNSARLSTVLQILIYLPLTRATLSTPAFLLLSLLLCIHSLIHGTMRLFWRGRALSLLQVSMHPFLLLVVFNAFSSSVPPVIITATEWYHMVLWILGPFFIFLEGISSLVVVQRIGQAGKQLVGEGEAYQFGLLIATAATYVVSAFWIAISYPASASSPLSASLLGVALTAFVFLTIIGFFLRRTNIIESSGLSVFLAYHIWLCGFGSTSVADTNSSYAPLLPNLVPHMETLVNFMSNTLPKPVLVALVVRLSILHLASRILPTIGADTWDAEDGVDDGWNQRPTSMLTNLVLTYRQLMFVMVYSHLLLLDHSSQTWWRWMNIFFTLTLWSIELLVSHGDDDEVKWKID